MNPFYFERYCWPKQYINYPPEEDLQIIIVIPSYKETTLLETIQSLMACDPIKEPVEVIVIINEHANESSVIKQMHEQTIVKLEELDINDNFLKIHIVYADNLPEKDFGVGLARKIGMDEAARRFSTIENPHGLIVCLDADCTVKPNYLEELLKFYHQKKSPGCSIYYEHPTNNPSIITYELHLRYFIHAQRFAGFVNAYQTVGSSMAVRADAYTKQGGMNKRKAGEDFYFIHKIISLGNFFELKSTTVYPSDRVSDRVPFGTGRAMQSGDAIKTYNPKSFIDLKIFLDNKSHLYENEPGSLNLPESIQKFLSESTQDKKIKMLTENSRDIQSFEKRFFQFFDAFQVMKYLHFARDNYYPNVEVAEAVDWLFTKYHKIEAPVQMEEKLNTLRNIDVN